MSKDMGLNNKSPDVKNKNQKDFILMNLWPISGLEPQYKPHHSPFVNAENIISSRINMPRPIVVKLTKIKRKGKY